nr:MAG TPA: hypothetical protein [Caudoviricetes sp.]
MLLFVPGLPFSFRFLPAFLFLRQFRADRDARGESLQHLFCLIFFAVRQLVKLVYGFGH